MVFSLAMNFGALEMLRKEQSKYDLELRWNSVRNNSWNSDMSRRKYDSEPAIG